MLRDPGLLGERAAKLARYPGGHQEGWPDALRGLLEDFYAAIEARRAGECHEPSFATFEDGHRIVQLVEAVTASHASRGWVELGRVDELV
jgi:predicted dehydrogenase